MTPEQQDIRDAILALAKDRNDELYRHDNEVARIARREREVRLACPHDIVPCNEGSLSAVVQSRCSVCGGEFNSHGTRIERGAK